MIKRIITILAYISILCHLIDCNFSSHNNEYNRNSKRVLDTQCQKGFYLNGEDCFECYENCLECNGVKCNQCELGYFPNEMNCFKCYENCIDCDGVNCIKCKEGLYPMGMDCYLCYVNCLDCDGLKCNRCVKGYYPKDMDCYKCYDNCLECDGSECLLCKDGYFPFKMSCFSTSKTSCNNKEGYYMFKKDYIELKNNPEYKFICLTKENVGSGYFIDSVYENNTNFSYWDSCSDNCLECQGKDENNCLKCDEINFFQIYEEKDIINGFKCYNKTEKLNYFIYEENSKKYLRKCSDNCLTCINFTKDKCTSCDNVNYFPKIEDIPNLSNGSQCFNEIELPNYYLYQNQYFKECIGVCSTNECDKSCTNCLIKDKYECLSCNIKDNYYPLSLQYNITKGTYKCYLKDDYPHYFINESDKTLVECSNSCKTCITSPTYCLSCADNAYYLQGSSDFKCYFEKPDINWALNKEAKQWEMCNERCRECSKQTNSDYDQQCTSCNNYSNYFPYQKDVVAWNKGKNKYNLTGFNCYKEEEVFDNYYLDPLNHTWSKCSKNCSKCENNPDNCLICNNDNEYYNIKYHKNGTCFKNPLPGYLLDHEKEFNKCFRTCKFCHSTSNSFFYMQCRECDEIKYTLANNSYEKSYCIPKDNSSSPYLSEQLKWYIDDYNNSDHYKIYDYEIFNDKKYENYDFKLTYKCPDDRPYIINSLRQCVSKCSNPDDIFEYGLFFYNKILYVYNNICYDTCPYGSFPDNKTMTCIEENKFEDENLIIKKEFYKYYQKYVDFYLTKCANNTILEIQSTEFTNYFYNSSTNDSWKYKQNMPIFDFDECVSLLAEEYNYSKDEIHIGIFQNNDLKKDNSNSILLTAINSTSFNFFLYNGTQINFSLCNGLKVNVKKPLNISLIENYKESFELLRKYNFSIFDNKNDILDNICIPLELNGKDVSLYIRQNILKSKINLCDNGCNFLGVDYDRNYSLCECKMIDDNKLGFGDFLKENVPVIEKAVKLKEKSNIIIFQCLTKTKFDNKNYIFYISLFFNLFHFILLILFIFIFYKKKLYKNENNIINKSKLNGNSYKFNGSTITEDNEDNLNSKRTFFNNNINNKKNDINKTISYKNNELENRIFNQNCFSKKEMNKIQSNDILKVKNNLSLSVPIPISKNYNNNKNEKNKNKFHIIFKEMIYKNLFEKFSFEKQLLYEYIIIISQTFIFLFQSFLFWNGLLNTEEYITKRFDEKNKIGFLYILANEFNKYFLTSLIIGLCLKILRIFFDAIKSIKLEELESISLKKIMFRRKCRIIFIEIIISLLHIFFLIFLYIFGNIYPNNKYFLIISCIISIMINMLFFAFCLLFASLIMTFPLAYECLRNYSNCINDIGEYLLKLI